jgi:AcrR family transcriptional regulator
MTRTGRRPGTPDTREKILAVARRGFATRGYDATSLRGIATDAEVDPALLIHYFGTKEGLFTAATGLPTGLSELFAGQQDPAVTAAPADPAAALRGFAESLVRTYLRFVDSDQSRNAILALVRSAVSNEKAAAMLREFLAAELLPVIASRTGHENAPLRASLVAAQLMGVAMLRHVVRLDPVARASPDEIVALVAPVIEQYLR